MAADPVTTEQLALALWAELDTSISVPGIIDHSEAVPIIARWLMANSVEIARTVHDKLPVITPEFPNVHASLCAWRDGNLHAPSKRELYSQRLAAAAVGEIDRLNAIIDRYAEGAVPT